MVCSYIVHHDHTQYDQLSQQQKSFLFLSDSFFNVLWLLSLYCRAF